MTRCSLKYREPSPGTSLQKNTSAGTGLGLSLSYDIVKAHGGEIKVETNKNEGSSFIIKLYV